LIVGWCGRFLFFVVPRQFPQDIGVIGRVARKSPPSSKNKRAH